VTDSTGQVTEGSPRRHAENRRCFVFPDGFVVVVVFFVFRSPSFFIVFFFGFFRLLEVACEFSYDFMQSGVTYLRCKKAFISLSLAWGCFLLLSNPFSLIHQIKPSPISSSLIVYLFTFGLCFVFSFSFHQLKPLFIFFSLVFFLVHGHCLLIKWVCILGQRSKLTHEIQCYTFQDCPNFPFFYGLCSLEFHSSDAKKPSIFLFFLFEWGKYFILLSNPSLFRHQIKYVETFSLIASSCVFLCFLFRTNSNLFYLSLVLFVGSLSLLADQMDQLRQRSKLVYELQ
jgi:hypothetical protein